MEEYAIQLMRTIETMTVSANGEVRHVELRNEGGFWSIWYSGDSEGEFRRQISKVSEAGIRVHWDVMAKHFGVTPVKWQGA